MISTQLESGAEIDASKIPTTANTSPATYFDWTEVPGEYWESDSDWHRTKKESYYKHLAELNQGRKVSAGRYNDRYITYTVNEDLIEALSTQLNLTGGQQARATRWFLSLDLERLGLRAECVAFAVCQYTIHEDESDARTCHPSCEADEVPDVFKRVRASLGIPGRKLDSIYGKIQHKIRTGSLSGKTAHDEYGIRALSGATLDDDAHERSGGAGGGGGGYK